MADCLDYEDPVAALKLLALASAARAAEQAAALRHELQSLSVTVPEILTDTAVKNADHPIHTVMACADSVAGSLTKIASGGSQASQEIRLLEQEKRDMDEHAAAVTMALTLRQQSARAAQSLSASAWLDAAEAVKPWLAWKDGTDTQDPRVRQYAGEYSLQQLESTYDKLKSTLLEQYESAVQKSDLQLLGQLTPILSLLRLEHEGVRLYKVYLESILDKAMEEAVQTDPKSKPPPYVAMGRVYNTAVATLRHHLPMVSHCLYKADGAAVIVQLVHVKTESAVLPIIQQYQRDRQLPRVARTATKIYAALEERLTGRGLVDESGSEDETDCGFQQQIGSLADVDAAMEEAAMCIQHSESYLRFLQHTVSEVNRARQLRHQQALERARMERERQEWTTGQKAVEEVEEEYKDMEILPASTPMHEAVAELGGQYAAIERCLLLASMQRAFVQSNYEDARYYRPMSTLQSAATVQALQTTLVETCLYAARRGSQRAFATGHAGTASAMTNFAVECLSDIVNEVLTRRAEDMGVHPLKPGEGLLVGSANLFNNASNLIRQGGAVGGVVQPAKNKDELIRKQKREEGIARACAIMNDLEVAVHHTQQLEALLNKSIDKGFPPKTHETEHLLMCVKSLGSEAESFRLASNSTIESLESVLKPRIRSIVGDAVGSDSSTFMGASSVMGGGKASDREMVRMNYDLDEEAYNLMQLSEGYVTRLCSLLDELLGPLRRHLAPRLWDTLLLSVLSTACKRLETSLRKCQYTALGGLTLDSDMRDLLSYTKDRLHSPEYGSNVAIFRACPALSKLLQIAKLLSVDDLDDVLDLISSAKRKGNWDLKLEDAKAFLSARVEFDGSKVNELLRLPDDD
jgi:conserved oligomeric Golgi complex subunit 4